MARIQEELLTIKISKLLRDTDENQSLINNELLAQLEVILKELAGQDVLVEIYAGE